MTLEVLSCCRLRQQIRRILSAVDPFDDEPLAYRQNLEPPEVLQIKMTNLSNAN